MKWKGGLALPIFATFLRATLLSIALIVSELAAASPSLESELSVLVQQVELFERSAEYEKALPVRVRMAEITENLRGPESDAFATAITSVALNQLKLRRPAEAVVNYRKATGIILRHHDRNDAMVFNVLSSLYAAEYSAMEIDAANQTAQQIVALLMDRPGTSPSDVARWQLNAAEPYLWAGSGRAAEGEPWLRKAYESLAKSTDPSDAFRIEVTRRLAAALSLQGRGEEAAPLQQEVIAGQLKLSIVNDSALANDRTILAGLLRNSGRYREAIGEAQRSLVLYQNLVSPPALAINQTKHMVINLYELVGDFGSAQQMWEEWLTDPYGSQWDGALVSDRAVGRAILLNGYGTNLARQGKEAEAEAAYREAIRLAGANEIVRNNAGSGLAEVLMARGDAAKAEPLLRAQFDLRIRLIGVDAWLGPKNFCCATATAFSAKALADALAAQGKMEGARNLYQLAARTELRFSGPRHPTTSLYHYLHARSMISVDAAGALVAARVAMEGARFRRLRANRTASPIELDTIYRGTSGYFTIVLDALFSPAATNATEAIGVAQEAMVSSTDGAIALMAAERLRKSLAPSLRAALDRRDTLAATAGELDGRLKASLISGRNPEEGFQLSRQVDAVANELKAIDTIIGKEFPEYYDLLRPGPVTLEEAQAALNSDEAVLLFVPADMGVHTFAITKDKILWRQSSLTSKQVEDLARQLLYAAGADVAYSTEERERWRSQTGGGADGYPRKAAYSLYRQLIEPVQSALSGKEQIFVASSGGLGAMPFSLLVSQEPEGTDNDPEALRATHWFADEFALVQLPSLQSLVALRRLGSKVNAGESRSSFAGFGDPVVGEPPSPAETGPDASRGAKWRSAGNVSANWANPSEALADVEILRSLDRLSNAATELRTMAAVLGAPSTALYLAELDTEAAVRTIDLSHTRILAFATHGLTISDGISAEPGLVFTPPATATPRDDGYLTASEAATLHLDADWVILSACNTAAGLDGAGSSGLNGLARGFFFAGARSVLASFWPVRDEVAIELTTLSIKIQKEHPGMRRSEAFRQAMRAVRMDRRHDNVNEKGLNETWAQPNAWAPFMLIGAGQE